MRRLALFASISALVLAVLPLAPAQAVSEAAAGAIPGSYIVVLNDGDPGAVAAEHSRRHNSSVTHVYRHALRGYAARMSERAAANVARDRRVAYVEQDGVVTASATQTNATWGLDRVDQRDLPLSTTYSYEPTGSGVTAYVVDTGIRRSHSEFGGRVTDAHFDAFTDGQNGEDCNGHGTHVAGTIGGSLFGIAKAVTLVPVRVLNCSGSGTWSGVAAGLDWIVGRNTGSAVANMSLGGGASTTVDDAVRRAIADGVTVVVAAGNGNAGGKEQDACGYSPARVSEAITIGATTSTDAKTSWSNYGDCVDWFAPGASITSAWYDSDASTKTISGTSMAAPHVAGVAALYLQSSATASPTTVRDALYAATTKGIVTSSKTANNHLLYSLVAPPTVPTAPTGLSAVAETASSIKLGWQDNSNNEDEFRIYRSLDGTTWTQITTVPPGTQAFTDTNLTPQETYYYKVTAYNAAGESSPTEVVSETTPAEVAPAAPTALSAVAETASSIKLGWQDNSNNEDEFRIYRSLDGTTWTQITTVPPGTQAFTDTSLTPEETYYYKVTAYNEAGESLPTEVVSETTPAENTASATASFTYSCSKTVCKFDASSSTGTTSDTQYSWAYGDGSSGTGITSSHAYPEEVNTYTVSLEVTNAQSPATANISCSRKGPHVHCK